MISIENVIVPLLVAFIATLWIHPRILEIALMKNIVDNPDARKLQRNPVPVLGGLAVFFGIIIGICSSQAMFNAPEIFMLMAAMLIPSSTTPNTQATNTNCDTSAQCSTLKGLYIMIKRNAKAAAEVTIIVRLRFVSKYRGIACEKNSIGQSVFEAKSTNLFAENHTLRQETHSPSRANIKKPLR